ncbi:MAG: hypothetical protein PWQ20_408 [Thermotogaceae bacterium]|nr:hypothetical protein [Thermotogaceae bacterium]
MRDKLEDLIEKITKFRAERNWKGNLKDLAISTVLEASELLEIFQWIPESELDKLEDKKIEHIKDEIADIFIYLIALCNKLNSDFYGIVLNKLEKTAKRYPINEN